jgi:hypothetical protein
MLNGFMAMQVILATFVLLVLLRWVAARYLRSKIVARADGAGTGATRHSGHGLSLRNALRSEALAWLLAVAVMGVLLLGGAAYAHFFGGIPPIHEWVN